MKPTLCTRCKKNVAVIFITKIENGASTNEGLCLKCAKDLGIKQVDDIVRQMGMSDEDLENMTNEMTSMMGLQPGEEDDDEDVASQTATFPFLNKLFGNADAPLPSVPKEQEKTAPKDSRKKKKNSLQCLTMKSRKKRPPLLAACLTGALTGQYSLPT